MLKKSNLSDDDRNSKSVELNSLDIKDVCSKGLVWDKNESDFVLNTIFRKSWCFQFFLCYVIQKLTKAELNLAPLVCIARLALFIRKH